MRGVVASGVAVAAVAAFLVAGPAGAADTDPRIDLRVLVVTDGTPGVDAVSAQLEREGVPFDSIDTRSAGRPTITATLLSPSAGYGKYQGVVVPSNEMLPAAENTALADYERTFGVRRIVAYTWAGPHVGLSTAWSGTMDGGSLTVTAAGKGAGFGYLAGTMPVDDRNDGVSGPGNLVIHGQHAGRASNEPARRHIHGWRLGNRARFRLVEHALHGFLDLTDVERLADVVEGPGPDRFDGGLQRAESAHQQDLAVWIHPFEGTQYVETIQRAIQVDVADDQVEWFSARQVEGAVRFSRELEFPPGRGEDFRDEPARVAVVVNDENSRHGLSGRANGFPAPRGGRS